jgi:hypothetical protein
MPYARHLRVTALGRLGTSPERFSYGINMAPLQTDRVGPFFGLAPSSGVWADIANDVRIFHTNFQSHLSPRAILEVVKVADIGADGKYLEDPIIVDVVDAPGGSEASIGEQEMATPQAALAISLLTARRGPTGKGRFYVPMPMLNLGQDMLANPARIAQVQASAATLLNNLGNAPGVDVFDLRPVVSSTKGYNSTVTAVRVGRVVDTIRSRRRSLDESFTLPTAVSF